MLFDQPTWKAAGVPFHNTSKLTFARLKDDPGKIARNLAGYIKSFSANVRSIFERFGFEEHIAKLDEHNRLFLVVQKFCDIDLHPDAVPNIEMGYIFEELIRRFNEAANETAGEHSKIFDTEDFGFQKITVERRLRLNFQASAERIERLREAKLFQNLATSKKKKGSKAAEEKIKAGRELQKAILRALGKLDGSKVYLNRDAFLEDLEAALKAAKVKIGAPVKKAIVGALSERDETADVCTDKDGNPEPDADLRGYENVPLKEDIHAYFEREVRPHVPDAWIDQGKTKVGYEIPLNRHFYKYQPPRPLEEIEADIAGLEKDIVKMLREVVE